MHNYSMSIKKYMDEIRRQQLNQVHHQNFPSISEMGKNLVQTVADSAKSVTLGEGLTITAEQAGKRLEICTACEFYSENRCTKCGCYLAVKTHLKAANCPVGKW